MNQKVWPLLRVLADFGLRRQLPLAPSCWVNEFFLTSFNLGGSFSVVQLKAKKFGFVGALRVEVWGPVYRPVSTFLINSVYTLTLPIARSFPPNFDLISSVPLPHVRGGLIPSTNLIVVLSATS